MHNANHPRIFISYSSIDEEIADLFGDLFDSYGIEYFLDRKEIDWGQSIETKISIGIESCSHLVVIISPASVRSEWVAYEVGQARALKKTILPFLTHPKMAVPPFLATLHYSTDFDDVRDYFRKYATHSVKTRRSEYRADGAMHSSVKADQASARETAEVTRSLSELPLVDLIEHAISGIDILVVTCSWIVAAGVGRALVSAMKRSPDLTTRVLCLDPESDFVAHRARQLGDMPSVFRDEGRASVQQLALLLKDVSGQSEIRTYLDPPMLTLFRIDDHLSIAPLTLSHRNRKKCQFSLQVGVGRASEEFMFHFEALWTSAVLYRM